MKIQKQIKTFIPDLILITLLAILIFSFSKNFAILHIRGDSMSPTYRNGNILILKKKDTVKKGDIVVFKSPNDWGGKGNKFIKRIIAEENDSVLLEQNKITVNDEIIRHDKSQCDNSIEELIELKSDEFLVMGDNRYNSNDSITQYCIGNENYLIDKDSLILYGEEFFVIGQR